MNLQGYQLVEALRKEADDVAREDRAALMRNAASYIEQLIKENRELSDERDTLEDELRRERE